MSVDSSEVVELVNVEGESCNVADQIWRKGDVAPQTDSESITS